MHGKVIYFGLLALLFTAGCDTTPEPQTEPSTQLSISKNLALESWIQCDDDIDFPATNFDITPASGNIERDNTDIIPGAGRNPNDTQAIIINGTAVDTDRRFPWAAQLYVYFNDAIGEYRSHCGGTILNENWIMTAAHCVDIREQEAGAEPLTFHMCLWV